MVKVDSVCTSYAFSPKLTVINSVMNIICSIVIFAWKGQWVSSFWHVFFLIVFALLIFFVIGILGYYIVGGLYRGNLPCVEHDLKQCPDCMRTYGFFGHGLLSIEPCVDHELPPFQYKIDPNDCTECKHISRRYGVRYYVQLDIVLTSYINIIYYPLLLSLVNSSAFEKPKKPTRNVKNALLSSM